MDYKSKEAQENNNSCKHILHDKNAIISYKKELLDKLQI